MRGGAGSARRSVAVSVDLDSVDCYFRIHGLGPAPAELRDVVLTRALPRAAALFAQLGVRATWFAVGADLDPAGAALGGDRAPRGEALAAARATLRALVGAGHELANHSYSHPYHLARLSPAQIADEVARCDRVLRALSGAPVLGFRSPGYDLSPALARALVDQGYRYDSSVFPAPPYYAAKAAVLAWQRVVGTRSGAVLTEPRALLAPRQPYRLDVDRPWRPGAGPLLELPISVTPHLRVPVIGTSLLLVTPGLGRRLLGALSGDALVNLELHGLDFADAALDELPAALVARQPDLRVPWADKRARLAAALTDLLATRAAAPLAELVDSLAVDAPGAR